MMKSYTVITFDNGYKIKEECDSGWSPIYYMESPDGRRTYSGNYDTLLTLDGLVAISPYHTGKENYVLMSPTEAITHVACVEMRRTSTDDPSDEELDYAE